MPIEINTQRLLLRKPQLTDAKVLFNTYTTNPAVAKYVTWKPHQSLQDTTDFLETVLAEWEVGDGWSYVIGKKPTLNIVGMVNLKAKDTPHIGYVLAEEEWGQGFTTEAVQVLLESAWEHTNYQLIVGYCDVDNPASARVMEKLGMKQKGIKESFVMHPNISNKKRDVYWYEIERPA